MPLLVVNLPYMLIISRQSGVVVPGTLMQGLLDMDRNIVK